MYSPTHSDTLRVWLWRILLSDNNWPSINAAIRDRSCAFTIPSSGSGFPKSGVNGVRPSWSSSRRPFSAGIAKGSSSSGLAGPGRPKVNAQFKALIKQMAQANTLWGAPRIHGELLKLGINISERTVSRLMPNNRKPPSQTWRTFLDNHFGELVSIDFLTVPTATFRVLYVFIVLAHDRRRVLHFNVTEHPSAAWTAQQIIETFPDETAPRFLLRDRDQIYGGEFRLRVAGMKIEEVITAARSPWQNAYVERLIGSIRRECLDHVIVLGEIHLRRILRSYFAYYHSSRTHLSLCKDAPELRAKQSPECGPVIEIAEVGGLHHRYERRVA